MLVWRGSFSCMEMPAAEDRGPSGGLLSLRITPTAEYAKKLTTSSDLKAVEHHW